MDEEDREVEFEAGPRLPPVTGALAQLGSSSVDLSDMRREAAGYVDPDAKWHAMAAAALKPTRTGHFSESFGNALEAYGGASQREQQLIAQYLPVVEQARLKRQQMALLQAKHQQEQLAGWNKTLTGSLAPMLLEPTLNPQAVQATIQGLVQRGMVPAPVAQAYISQLPSDPTALRAYLRQQALSATDPFRAVAAPKFMSRAEGADIVAVNPSGTAEVVAEGSRATKPTELARYQAELEAMPPDDPRRAQHQDMIRKLTTHTPPVSVNVNAEKPFANSFFSDLGKAYAASRESAVGAQDAINTLTRLESVLDSKKVILGPGANVRLEFAKLGQLAGFGGKSNEEVLANTQSAIISLAKLSMAGAKQMAGQGQITDFERQMIAKAESGDLNMTEPQLRALIVGLRKVSNRSIARYNDLTKRVKAIPELSKAADLMNLPADEGVGTKTLRFDNQGNIIQE